MDAAPERHFSTAVDAVVTRFGGMVRQVGRRHRLGEAELDEVLQDVRIRLWRSQQSGEQVEHVSASYVYRTAMSAAVDLLRRRRSRRADSTVPIEAHGDRLPDGPAASPDADLAVSELARQVARAIETISAARRPVVRMYLAGYPRAEIADLLGWSEAKTRNLLYRGLADLRTRLTEQGIGLEWKEKTA